MGHSIDILAYPIGEPIQLENVRVHRVPKLPFIKSLRMGPSIRKLILDVLLAMKTAWWLLHHGPYDIVLAHEESAYWIAIFRPFFKGIFIYDMHSSLVEQLGNFKYCKSSLITKIFAYFERKTLEKADGVIVICSELESLVRGVAPHTPLGLIENLPVSWDVAPPSFAQIEALRLQLGLAGSQTVLYTGSFGKNQGIELAMEAVSRVRRVVPRVQLLLVGGTGADLARVRTYAKTREMEQFCLLLEPQPHSEMPAYTALADILISPRTEGTNTPLKIYSYLASGKAIIATNLLTHTQVLTPEVAELVEPDSESIATGILNLLNDKTRADKLGIRAAKLAHDVYGIERYMAQLQSFLDVLVKPHCKVS